MLNPKVRAIVEDIANGDAKNLRESLSDIISEKAVSALEIKKVDVAKNFFAQDIREEKEDKDDDKDDDKKDDDEDGEAEFAQEGDDVGYGEGRRGSGFCYP